MASVLPLVEHGETKALKRELRELEVGLSDPANESLKRGLIEHVIVLVGDGLKANGFRQPRSDGLLVQFDRDDINGPVLLAHAIAFEVKPRSRVALGRGQCLSTGFETKVCS